MLDTQSKISTSVRTLDITTWEEVHTTRLNSRQKRRFQKHKDALIAYFTTDASLDEIAAQHSISASSLLSMAEKCLMHYEDGSVRGFRALLPGANVVDYTPPVQETTSFAHEISADDGASFINDETDNEITAKRPALLLQE